MILFGSIFKFQEPPFMLVDVLINFGVKNQVSQVSFKIDVRDLMSVLAHEFYWLWSLIFRSRDVNDQLCLYPRFTVHSSQLGGVGE